MYRLATSFVFSFVLALAAGTQYFRLPGRFIDISAKGEELWAIDKSQDVFRFDFDIGRWTAIPAGVANGVNVGKPSNIAASPDGYTWLSTDEHRDFRYNPSKKLWESQLGYCWQVNVASKDNIVCTATDDYMWRSQVNTADVNDWKKIATTIPTQWAAIGEDEEIWRIEKGTRKVYRAVGAAWELIPTISAVRGVAKIDVQGAAGTLDVQNKNRVVLTSIQGRVYLWNNREWNRLDIDNAAKATIGATKTFILNEIGEAILIEI